MPTILITGSSGQIGTNLFFGLRRLGFQVMGVDRRPNPWTGELPTVVTDLTDRAQVDALGGGRLGGLDLVVHLAAHAKVFELVQRPERALENIVMTYHALELSRRAGIPFIFGSSREVYGDIHRIITGESDADFVIAESPYSASKISGEALTYSYARCYGLNYLTFRFSNVYGRYDNDLERMERVVPLFIDRIARGEEVVVFGEQKVLDFTYVDDCVDGIILGIRGLLSGRVKNQTFNLAYGEGSSLVQLAHWIAEELSKPLNLRLEPSRPGEVTHYVANISKARSILGYEPKVPLREGARRTVAWWRECGRLSP
ncbi:MAG: NAD-dependent epimerase/dehydratase family protein [Planctomycetes bacterium]|nr:NAD-dependent epimerase/dehydratase family protein [Planctomycetota bacterium]